MSKLCPCESQKPYTECCKPLLEGEAATTPEALMRSRFVAFVNKDLDYIQNTTDPQALSEFDLESTAAWANNSEFTHLEIIRSSFEGNKGMVEFKAQFKTQDGVEHLHHEISKFRKQKGIWYFRDGRVMENPKEKSGEKDAEN